MLIKSIKAMQLTINSLPESSEKKGLIKNLKIIEKESAKVQTKYLKTNEDKLTLSHLLSKINDELEDALSNEKRFIASVSHELRTPLTAILGYSELLHDTTLNNKQKRYLKNIIQSSDHLLSLISDLSDVAKLEDNRIELSLKEFELDDALNECATLIKSKITTGVDFIVDIPLLDYPVLSDKKRVKQIFINLLSNAAKFTKKGSIHFYVKDMEELEHNRLKMVINIDDTGDGIPGEVADTLFDPFQSTDKTQGTGLGLYISQQLAHLMEGEIAVDSKSGIGSSFSATIIVERSAKKEIGKELRGANIMMLTDKGDFNNKLQQEFMGLGVNYQNYSVINNDISSALVQMVASGKFYDIAIFDIDIFKDNTSYIAGTLKAINPEIKLVALVEEDSDKFFSEFHKVLHKPISYQRFIKAIDIIYSEEFFDENRAIDYSRLDILIVEDVEINREYEKEMLNNFFSISCDTAVNGQEAVEKVQKREYDAVLMDMRMPVMDGLEATRAIREFNKEIPIICMSANVYKEDKLAAKNSGMNDFIEKPLDKFDIESKLLKLINKEFTSIEAKQIESKVVLKSNTIDGAEMKNISLSHLQKNFNIEISNKLFIKAMESISKYIIRIEKSFQEKDTTLLVEDFHIIKGVCSNIGLIDIANEAGRLQKLAEKGELLPLVSPSNIIVAQLKLLLDEVK